MQQLGIRVPAGVRGSARIRVPLLVLGGLLLLWALAVIQAKLTTVLATPGVIGFDLDIYTARTSSWIAGDGFYLPRQLTGEPYTVSDGDAMYPPVVMLLLLPWVIGAPAILWWVIPLTILAVSIWQMRPSLIGLVILAWMLGNDRFLIALICGNPSLWALAFLAAGLIWRWPAALVPLKLTLAPFALVGIRDGRWWVVAAFALLVCLPFGALWLEYPVVLVNARSPVEYPLGEWPLAIGLLLVAWTGHRHSTIEPTRPVPATGGSGAPRSEPVRG